MFYQENSYQFMRKKAEEINKVLQMGVKEHKPIPSHQDSIEMIHELQVHKIELELQNEELKRIHLELEEKERRYFDLYDLAPLIYVTLNEQGLIQEANVTATIKFGLSKQKLIKKSLTHFIVKEDQDIYYLFQKKFLQSEKQEVCELRMKNHSNEIFYAHMAVIFTKNINNEKISRLIISDITQHKHIEEELEMKNQLMMKQSQQSTMDEMIGMIAHEWRQPLNSIAVTIMNTQLQISLNKYDLSKKEEREKFITFIMKKLDDISDFVRNLSFTIDDFRDFFNTDKKISEFDINDVLDKTHAILKDIFIHNNITFKTQLEKNETIVSYKRELMQVIINIINYSKNILVSHNKKDGFIHCKIGTEGNYVTIEISDNSGGIKEEVFTKIFDPYLSTEEEKEVTNLGLYMCKIIIEDHLKGTIQATNRDLGACFIIKLPKSV